MIGPMNTRSTDRRRSRPLRLDHEPRAVTWARENAGLTKRQLAARIGISEQLLGDVEAGRRNLTPANLRALASATDFPDDLLRARAATPAVEKRLFTTAEAAIYIGRSVETLRGWRVRGEGPRFVGRHKGVRYDLRDLDAWIESEKRTATR
jgi:transcriptional regulator with XRE-family HTH domain